MEINGFECCFCKKGIEESYLDPCDINIVINSEMAKDLQDRSSINLYSHFNCLKQRLHNDIQGYLNIFELE